MKLRKFNLFTGVKSNVTEYSNLKISDFYYLKIHKNIQVNSLLLTIGKLKFLNQDHDFIFPLITELNAICNELKINFSSLELENDEIYCVIDEISYIFNTNSFRIIEPSEYVCDYEI